MKTWVKIRLFWWALTIFWLFAVYSTSIWKSFDQRLTVSVMQNIETVKAFNTFLDDTIISTTQSIIDKVQIDSVATTESLWTGWFMSWENAASWNNELEISWNLVPTLDTLKKDGDDQVKLVDQWTKKVQLRNNYVLFRIHFLFYI